MYRSSPLRSTLNTNVITGLGMRSLHSFLDEHALQNVRKRGTGAVFFDVEDVKTVQIPLN